MARTTSAAPVSPTTTLFATRPMAQTARIALFEKEVRERLSRSALDIIMTKIDVLSEGQRATRGGRSMFLGSTMLTLTLDRLAPFMREPADAGTAHKLAGLMREDTQVAGRLRNLCAREVERLAQVRPTAVTADMKITSRGTRVLVDVDVEAHLG